MTVELHASHGDRMPSRIPGLDLILKGGFVPSSVSLVMGRPGAGKTILGNQMAFEHVRAGGRSLYVTLLTESHARLFGSLETMTFFDPEQVGRSLTFLSGYQILQAEKLAGLSKLLRTEVRDRRASLLIVDGLMTAGGHAETPLALKEFLHELQIMAELVGCTVVLLTGATEDESNYAERTMVDGLIQLSMCRSGMRTVREIEVLKLRGSDILHGRHFFDISDSGITVHPRTESFLGRRPWAAKRDAVEIGIESLDQMPQGGVLQASATLVFGAPGSGKTLIGMTFLGTGADRGEPGLYFGFIEPPDRIIRQAKGISLDIQRHVDAGLIEMIWEPHGDQIVDALASKLIRAIEARNVRRLFIDGFEGFEESLVYPERMVTFFSALMNELRTLGVTVIVSHETVDLFGPMVHLPEGGVSPAVENIILLRYVELRSQLRRLVSIIKMREGAFDTSTREFSITDRGVIAAETFESAESILSGVARPLLSAGETPSKKKKKKKKKAKRRPKRKRN